MVNYKSFIKMFVIIFGLLITFNLAAYAQQTNCSEQTDKELVLKVYEKLKTDYDNQISHINVRAYAYDGVVVLEGYVLKKSDLKKIIKLVSEIDCINSVVTFRLKVGKGLGCGPGQQECGGSCISNKVTCNICLGTGKCN